jgi:lipid-A-disaccharide synthase
VAHVRPLIEKHAETWAVKPHIIEGDENKFRAFRLAHAALAASGTVTLELALAGTPMVVAYKVDGIAAHMRFLLKVHSVVLATLVLGENAFPELLQEDCTPEKLAGALELLLRDTPERNAQLEALARIPHKMLIEGSSPSEAAADIVLDYAVNGRRIKV